jgi:hypothetical protein
MIGFVPFLRMTKWKPRKEKTQAGLAQSEALRLGRFVVPEDRRASLCASQFR